LNFFKEVFRTIFTPLKFVEMLLEGFSYALSIMNGGQFEHFQ
jgi:hypothetical protein